VRGVVRVGSSPVTGPFMVWVRGLVGAEDQRGFRHSGGRGDQGEWDGEAALAPPMTDGDSSR
jgi:hypothetical protein